MIQTWNKHLFNDKKKNDIAIVEVNKASTNCYTWGELKEKINIYKKILKDNEFTKGMRIAIEDGAGVDFICKIWACFDKGIIWSSVPYDTPIKRRENQIMQGGMHGVWERNLGEIKKRNGGDKGLGAYIYFTSGSGGMPKAVEVDGWALEDVWRWQGESFNINKDSVVGWMLNVCFDASLSDIGVALSHGCKLIIFPEKTKKYQTWKKIINEWKVTHIDMPPSLLEIWAEKSIPKSLETIIIGGEMAGGKTINMIAGKIKLVNVYGPTECTICTSLAVFNKNSNPGWIGEPAPHVLYKIDGENAQDGQKGELWIGGKSVALGYVNDNEQTKERFVEKNGKRWFKTGDNVRYESGRYIYTGRIDKQRKINGQMVNLGEIESVIKQVVSKRVVVEMVKNKIIVFCDSMPLVDVREEIKNHLPSWAYIHKWIKMDTWPSGINGKIDREKIKKDYENGDLNEK